MMYTDLFHDFLKSSDTLQVYEDGNLLFASAKDRLTPLLEYIDTLASDHRQAVIFDRIMGNAAALLSVKADCDEVYSPLGSRLAIATLDKYHIKHHLSEIIPCITRPGGEDMCPMEKSSIAKTPDEFYQAIRSIISQQQQTGGRTVNS